MRSLYTFNNKQKRHRESGLLYRERLVSQIDRALDSCGIVFIEGQVAQGKMTLVHQYIERTNKHPIYIELEEGDKKPEAFLKKIQNRLSCNGSDKCSVATLTRNINLALKQLRDILFVFERVDILASNKKTCDLLRQMQEETHRSVNFIFVSRSKTVEKLALHEIAYPTISNTHLAFTLEECKQYFSAWLHPKLPEKTVEELFAVTGGWPGGIALLADSVLSLNLSHQILFHAAEGSPPPIVMGEKLFRLFEDEVMTQQSEKQRRRLLLSSQLGTMDSGLLQRVFGESFVKSLLNMAEHNQFVEAYYELQTKNWIFCYQNLFQAFLEAKFYSWSTIHIRDTLFYKAAEYFASVQKPEQALYYYAQARRYDKCTDILKVYGMSEFRQGNLTTLKKLLELLPIKIISSNPWLSMLSQASSPFHSNTELDRSIANAFMFTGDDRGTLLSLAFFLLSCNIHGVNSPAVTFALNQVDALLPDEVEGGPLYELSFLFFSAGLWILYRSEEAHKGFSYFNKAYTLAHKNRDVPLQILTLSYSILSASYLKCFQQAKKLHNKLVRILLENPELEKTIPFRSLVYTTLSTYLSLLGEIEKAKENIEKSMITTKAMGSAFLTLIAAFSRIMVNKYLKNYSQAREIAQDMIAYSTQQGENCQLGPVLFHYGSLEYFAGQDKKSRELLEKALELATDWQTSSTLYEYMTRITLSLVHLHNHPLSYEEIHYLKELVDVLAPSSDSLLYINAELVLGLALCLGGNLDEGKAYIQHSLALAERNDLKHFFLINENDTLHVLMLAMQHNLLPSGPWTIAILTNLYSKEMYNYLERFSQDSDSSLSNRAVLFMSILRKKNIPPLSITTLGEFCVQRGEYCMQPKDWLRSQAMTLLKLIIARGGKNIPKDVLMEDLWEENTEEMQTTSFKVLIHRLRKSLEPKMDSRWGSAYLLLHDNYISLDEDLCNLDNKNFMQLLGEGHRLKETNQEDEALAYYEKAMELYKADFLQEDLYSHVIIRAREELQYHAVKTLKYMAQVYEGQEDLDKAIESLEKALTIIPFDEEIYYRLMSLLAATGRHSYACLIYKHCKSMMEEHVGAKPSTQTHELYKQLRKLSEQC